MISSLITSSPTLISYCDEQLPETASILSQDLLRDLKIDASDDNKMANSQLSGQDTFEEDGEIEEFEVEFQEELSDHEDEDFSFAYIGADSSPIPAEDAFQDGQISPMFPLFNRDLLLGYESSPPRDKLPLRTPVRKVFVQARDPSIPPSAKSSASETEEIEEEVAGPYCAWSGKAIEASPEVCKKSNSTGFLKIWRFRDLLNRNNSAGRDAYVFLNGSTTAETTVKKEENVEKKQSPSSEKVRSGEGKVQSAGEGNVKAKAAAKRRETTPLSAHEMHYLRNKSWKEWDRPRRQIGRRRRMSPANIPLRIQEFSSQQSLS